MNTAKYVCEVDVIDPDTGGTVTVAMYKDNESGGIFGIDASYILTLSDDDPVNNPFNGEEIELIEEEKESIINLDNAIEEANGWSDDKVYVVQVGVYDIEHDTTTPVEVLEVAVAAPYPLEASEYAVSYCESNMKLPYGHQFMANVIDANEY